MTFNNLATNPHILCFPLEVLLVCISEKDKHEFQPPSALAFGCLSQPAIAFELNYTTTTKRFCLISYSYIVAAVSNSFCGVQKQRIK